jgi:hypothetical protein
MCQTLGVCWYSYRKNPENFNHKAVNRVKF